MATLVAFAATMAPAAADDALDVFDLLTGSASVAPISVRGRLCVTRRRNWSQMDIQEINRRVIEQLRSGAPIEGMNRDRLLLLTTTGRRTGQQRTTPLRFDQDGEDLLVIASNVGAPKHPDWYLNLAEDPRAGRVWERAV